MRAISRSIRAILATIMSKSWATSDLGAAGVMGTTGVLLGVGGEVGSLMGPESGSLKEATTRGVTLSSVMALLGQ
jgi:hypothetical protein